MLSKNRYVSFSQLLERLEVSPATLKRALQYMRDRLNAPILFSKENGGYHIDHSTAKIGNQYELPGLWFSAEEIHALLTMQHLLSNLDTGGLLGPHIKPLLARLTAILGTGNNEIDEVQKRIKAENIGARQFHLDHFQAIGSALLRRKRIIIEYLARGTGESTIREVSPQRLVFYRGNWYLDSWCHLRKGVRNFAVDAITSAEIMEKVAEDVSEKDLNAALGNGYGIFNGDNIHWARLKFTPSRAKWVRDEKWHNDQISTLHEDGSYELKIPYSDDRELMMDIMKYGADVEIIEPESLRVRVTDEIRKLSTIYLS
jgi:predicted DNA-binding transcriptional regulator YafY